MVSACFDVGKGKIMKPAIEHLLSALQALVVEFDKSFKSDPHGERTYQLIKAIHGVSELIRHVQEGRKLGE